MLAELIAIAIVILVGIAEIMHAARVKRLAPLAFGPKRKPALWVYTVPVIRPIAPWS